MKEVFLGELGEETEVVNVTFNYFGSKLRAHPDSSELEYVDFIGKAIEVDEKDEVESYHLTMGFLKQQIHPDDWDTFWQLARKHRQSVAKLMVLSQKIMEAASGFPTTQPSDSSSPPAKRQTKSKAVSRSKQEVALQHLEGRPDLKQAVYLAQQQAN